jgi:predicted phage tail protein
MSLNEGAGPPAKPARLTVSSTVGTSLTAHAVKTTQASAAKTQTQPPSEAVDTSTSSNAASTAAAPPSNEGSTTAVTNDSGPKLAAANAIAPSSVSAVQASLPLSTTTSDGSPADLSPYRTAALASPLSALASRWALTAAGSAGSQPSTAHRASNAEAR